MKSILSKAVCAALIGLSSVSVFAKDLTLLRCNILSGDIAEVKVVQSEMDGKIYIRLLKTSGATLKDRELSKQDWLAKKFDYLQTVKDSAGTVYSYGRMAYVQDAYDGKMAWWYENGDYGSKAVGYADCE